MSNIVGVALVHKLCPICRSKIEEEILMNSVLTEENAKEVESMHNKCIGFSNNACDKCAEHKEALYIVEIDGAKSDKNSPYFLSNIIGIKKDCDLAKHIKDFIQTTKNNVSYCYMDSMAGKELGLWK